MVQSSTKTKQISFKKDFQDVVEYLESDKVENMSEFICLALRHYIDYLNPKPNQEDELTAKISKILEEKLKNIQLVKEVPQVVHVEQPVVIPEGIDPDVINAVSAFDFDD
jgi:hypothetical protein